MWFQSLSSGRYRSNSYLPLAWRRKSSVVNPSICGTADTLTADLFMYYRKVSTSSYILLTPSYKLKEEDVDGVYLREVGLTLLT
jgi:hypothetical protein